MTENRRDQLIEYVEKELVGPDPVNWPGFIQSNGEEILINESPRTRYIAGILFPKETNDSVADDAVSEMVLDSDNEINVDNTLPKRYIDFSDYLEESEELINRSNAYRQSAISLTAAIKKDDTLYVEVSAGKYRKESVFDKEIQKTQTHYFRSSVEWNNNHSPIAIPTSIERFKQIPVGDTGLQFDITYRYELENSIIYTFTLENTYSMQGGSIKDEECFFQTKFKVFSSKGFGVLSEGKRVTEDEDYQSNCLLYRNVHNYALGHGCGADWDDSESVKWISTSIFPKFDVKPIVPNTIPGVSLEMYKMSPYGNFSESLNELLLMCQRYRDWINNLKVERRNLDPEYSITAERHISNCEMCLKRMEDGITLLEQNEQVKIAFQYMNLAMLMQQLHYNFPLNRWEENSQGELVLSEPFVPRDVHNKDTWGEDKDRYGKWRPFQLAFILMNLRSMFDRDCKERGTVDLIWFPTGGGKTEAYLGLSAYTIFIRRLMNKDDQGTAILMRYTLRLLTAQQYERASSMICACDFIRRQHEDLFGKHRISIGLWVGGSTTPNSEKEAVETYDKLVRDGGPNPFVILKCPWCGAQMGVIQKGLNIREMKGYYKKVGPRKSKKFAYRCSNTCCDYSSIDLPLFVIDETIYSETPTLLLGTVDKFAMLPFKHEAKSLFGFNNGIKLTTPDLIIQDELHLISGPLGSMVGHYETMIHELCTLKTDGNIIRPKVVASTATISRAKEQCHALYACDKEDVFQFPPSGLDAGNSFFALENKEQNGRRYVGIFASGSSSDTTTSIRVYAALLYGAKALKVQDEKERDPYWTNMGYYNSIRELGQASTWIHADIEQHLDVMYKRKFEHKKYQTREEYQKSRRYIYSDEELTSRISGNEVTSSLAKLNVSYPPKTGEDGRIKDYPIDICLATNMISVGLDISRLGLMTVSGQPKTTSEYIQATSRVGRNSKDAPGLVFVIYRPGRPRDKSHYEHFKSYHSKIYCNVEPTSVTPFSAPVRERALHAILIGLIRMESENSYNEDVPTVPATSVLNRVRNIIENRVDVIDRDELDDTIKLLDDLINKWKDWCPDVWDPKKNRDYSYNDLKPLMYFAGTSPNEFWEGIGFETPTSMRSVDASCEAYPISDGNRYTQEEE